MDYTITLRQSNYRENFAEEVVGNGHIIDVVAEPPRSERFWNFTTFTSDHPIREGDCIALLNPEGGVIRRYEVTTVEELSTTNPERTVDLVRMLAI